MARGNDKPKVKASPPEKAPRIGTDPESTNGLTPVWSIAKFDHEGPWGQGCCENNGGVWVELFPKLRDYESMTWGEIYKDRKRNHSVPVYGLIKEAKERLEELNLDDVEE